MLQDGEGEVVSKTGFWLKRVVRISIASQGASIWTWSIPSWYSGHWVQDR